MALFESAPSEGSESRKAAAKSNVYSTMAFSDMEKENEVHILSFASGQPWPCIIMTYQIAGLVYFCCSARLSNC